MPNNLTPTARPVPLPPWEETPAEVAAWDRWYADDDDTEPDDDPDD